MVMIVKLPTKSDRRYRGKYPTRVHSMSYSRSYTQDFIQGFLRLDGRPMHFELNNGERYIVSMRAYLEQRHGVCSYDFGEIIKEEAWDHRYDLSQPLYDEMLAKIKLFRETNNG